MHNIALLPFQWHSAGITLTHLSEILNAFQPKYFSKFAFVINWMRASTLVAPLLFTHFTISSHFLSLIIFREITQLLLSLLNWTELNKIAQIEISNPTARTTNERAWLLKMNFQIGSHHISQHWNSTALIKMLLARIIFFKCACLHLVRPQNNISRKIKHCQWHSNN